MREKAHHTHGEHGQEGAPGAHPGQLMIQAIADCQVLICGGMGAPAYNRAVDAGMQVFLTLETSIDAAIQAYQSAKLESDLRLIHVH